MRTRCDAGRRGEGIHGPRAVALLAAVAAAAAWTACRKDTAEAEGGSGAGWGLPLPDVGTSAPSPDASAEAASADEDVAPAAEEAAADAGRDGTAQVALPPPACPLLASLSDEVAGRLPRSVARLPLPEADRVEVHAGAILHRGEIVAVLPGREDAPAEADAPVPPPQSGTLEAALRAVRTGAVPGVGDAAGGAGSARTTLLLAADHDTPALAVREVFAAAKKAGYERLLLLAARSEAVAEADPGDPCAAFSVVSFGLAADRRGTAPSPAGTVGRDAPVRILDLESLTSGPAQDPLVGIASSSGIASETGIVSRTDIASPQEVSNGTVRLGSVRPAGGSGRMDASVFRAALQRKLRAIEACYEQALPGTPQLAGDLVFVTTIQIDGGVAVEVERDAPDMAAAGVTECIRRRLGSLRFSTSPPEGGDFRVRIPLSFAPAAGRLPIAVVHREPIARARQRPAPQAPPELRLTLELDLDAVTLSVSSATASLLAPEDPASGEAGRVRLPHVPLRADAVEEGIRSACRPPPEGDAGTCAHWRYHRELHAAFRGALLSEHPVPDLRGLHEALRRIADGADREFAGRLADRRRIVLAVADDVPVKWMVAVADFAAFREFAFDWTAAEAFLDRREEIASGALDPFLLPDLWDDALRAALLFPIVELAGPPR
jgi:hypothetical protein